MAPLPSVRYARIFLPKRISIAAIPAGVGAVLAQYFGKCSGAPEEIRLIQQQGFLAREQVLNKARQIVRNSKASCLG